jgi:hypothetical protein
MKVPFLKNQQQIIIGAVALSIVLGLWLRPSAPSREEFFKNNPHLHAPEADPKPEPEIARKSDSFLPGDFALKAGKEYLVEVMESTAFTANKKSLLDSTSKVWITLHSYGMRSSELTVIADFRYEFLKNRDKKSALKPETSAALGMKTAKVIKNANSLLVRLRPEGKITAMAAADAKPDLAALELKVALLSSLFKRARLSTGKYRITEFDLLETPYPVDYDVRTEGNSIKIRGSLAIHDAPKASAGAAVPAAILALDARTTSEFEWLWGSKESHPLTQMSSARNELSAPAMTLALSESRFSATWHDEARRSRGERDPEEFKTGVDFRSILRASMNRKKIDLAKKNKKIGLPWSSVLGKLSSVNKNGLTEEEKENLFIDFSRGVKEDPSRVGLAKQLALDAPPGSRIVSMVLGALGYSGTPEAQNAMIELFKRENATPDERQKVVTEFALAPATLTGESKDFLRDVYQKNDPMKSDLAGTAGLALGASIARDGDPDTVKFLKQEWSGAGGLLKPKDEVIDKKAYLLTVMGNSKSDVFLSQVSDSFGSSNNELRSAAVNALRFNQDEKGRGMLFSALSDSNEQVRQTAAASLRYQPFDSQTLDALKSTTQKTSESLSVKLEAYRLLVSRMDDPSVKQYLESRLNSETDGQLQRLIREAFQGRIDGN